MSWKYSILYRNYIDECYKEKNTNSIFIALINFLILLPKYDGVDFIKRK